MKLAKIDYIETDYPDEAINETFIVEYTKDFKNKLKKLDRFEEMLDEYEWDEEEAELTKAEFKLIEEHYEGSKIDAISSYICSLFNIVQFEQEIERTW